MTVTVIGMEGVSAKIRALMDAIGPANRIRLNSVGAKALEVKVRRHIAHYAPMKHFTASSLGARRTGHFEKGANRIASDATPEFGRVTIPIPGIGRAYHAIKLDTPTATGKRYFTIPKHAAAYGSTVGELRRMGWKIFRPGQKKILLGYRQKGEKPVILFALAERVEQRQDPSLLPTEAECSRTVCEAVKNHINMRLGIK